MLVSQSVHPMDLLNWVPYANFAYSQSTTDTTKTSSNFARDVVDRSVSRIQKKTREERITKTIQEVEEINTHGLNNVGGPGHITGVYRWVDKHYKSQVYNYGEAHDVRVHSARARCILHLLSEQQPGQGDQRREAKAAWQHHSQRYHRVELSELHSRLQCSGHHAAASLHPHPQHPIRPVWYAGKTNLLQIQPGPGGA